MTDQQQQYESYTTATITMGILNQQEVSVAYVPRSDFLKVVQHALTCHPVSDANQERLLDTARTMPSFPLGQWVHETRGCGCLVGEYLIAANHMSRAELTQRLGTARSTDIAEILREADSDDFDMLEAIGLFVDTGVAHLLPDPVDAYDDEFNYVSAVVFIEDDGTVKTS
jgi:hypothetical protein